MGRGARSRPTAAAYRPAGAEARAVSIWAFAVRRWQFTLVLFALLIALGVASFMSIARSEDPTFPFPATTITIVWPGADPSDMERVIVKPLEDAVNSLDTVNKIVSPPS